MIERKGAGILFASVLATVLLGCLPSEQTKTDSPYSASVREARIVGDQQREEDYQLTASERRMRSQGRNFDRTVWQGVLIGAAGGALWGLIEGGDAATMLKSVAIGAAVGGLAGAYIAHKQKQYAEKEDQLESMILDVRESNEDAEALITSVSTVIAEDQRRLASVDRQYKQGVLTHEALKQERSRLAANRAVVKDALNGAKEKYTMFREAKHEYEKRNPTIDTQRFKFELEAYNEHIEALDTLAEGMGVA